MSEESGIVTIGRNPRWVIILDPLDGSSNFVSGIPISSISLAAGPIGSSRFEELELGMVKDVFQGALYYALKGVEWFIEGCGREVRTGDEVRIVFCYSSFEFMPKVSRILRVISGKLGTLR